MAGKVIGRVLLALLLILLLLAVFGTAAHAAGLVDDTVDAANEYSKYPLDNYQLDFYVDSGWDWLPWNWLDGIGKQVMYGLYAITNFIWTISLYLSNATGYLIQEAYSLDFISSTADSIGKNMQTLAGVTTGGLSSEGFYIGFLLILILVVGIYVAYTGLIKRETTKAIHAVVNFVVVFVLSAAFIAYAPDYIGKINEFSADISNASLTLGTKIVLPNSESQGKDSVDLIRDSLFSIQVKQPWLLLQYGNSDVESLGADRVERLLSTSPDENNGQDREEIVVEEIEDRENTNLTITKTINRLGTVFFLFMFNIGISIFVFLLTGIMIFSQVLFIIYAMFLPVSFSLAWFPLLRGCQTCHYKTVQYHPYQSRNHPDYHGSVQHFHHALQPVWGISVLPDGVLADSDLCRNLFQAGGFDGDVLLTEWGFPKHGKPYHAKTPVCSCTPICTVYSIS